MGERVGGHTKIVEATPTIETSAYASGDLIGGKITLTGALRFGDKMRPGTGVVHSAVLIDRAKQSVNVDVVLFDTDPTNTTFTDNAAFDPADADLANVLGVIAINTWHDFANNSVGLSLNVGIVIDVGSAKDLYAALVSRGAPTYVAAGDLTLRLGILQD